MIISGACGQTAVVVGLARQGIALAHYLAEHGCSIRASDLRPSDDLGPALKALQEHHIDFVLGEHPLSLLDGADIIFVSGGVPMDIPLLQQARERGIPLSNDSQLFLEKTPCKVVGVTGSGGKSTTTLLAGRMAAACGHFHNVWVGGNLGSPLLADVDRMTSKDVAIMELSSFQLEIITTSPAVAAILNITPNHLDRHATMDAYVEAKLRILDGQRACDVAVLSWEDEKVRRLRGHVRGSCWGFGLGAEPSFMDGCHLDGERIMLRRDGVSIPFADSNDIQMPGMHNKLNVLAAATVAVAAGVTPTAIPAVIRGFQSEPHHMELVGKINHVRWINDTMATTPERTMTALQSVTAPVILLLGGRDKNLPWESLAERVITGVKAIILFGEAAVMIERELRRVWAGSSANKNVMACNGESTANRGLFIEREIKGSSTAVTVVDSDYITACPTLVRVEGLEKAVQKASNLADAGDVVLLSPGCTSFDYFSDASARGEMFRELVKRLS